MDNNSIIEESVPEEELVLVDKWLRGKHPEWVEKGTGFLVHVFWFNKKQYAMQRVGNDIITIDYVERFVIEHDAES